MKSIRILRYWSKLNIVLLLFYFRVYQQIKFIMGVIMISFIT